MSKQRKEGPPPKVSLGPPRRPGAKPVPAAAPAADPDPFALAVKNEERTKADPEQRAWYTIDPDVVYPAMLKLIAPLHAANPEALALDGPALEALEPEDRAARAAVLERCRTVFTDKLAKKVGAPIGLTIMNRPRWRL